MSDPVTLTPHIGYQIDEKRFRLPITFTAPCPGCGADVKADLGNRDYLNFPKVGVFEDFPMYHYCGGSAEADWSVRVRLDVSVTVQL